MFFSKEMLVEELNIHDVGSHVDKVEETRDPSASGPIQISACHGKGTPTKGSIKIMLHSETFCFYGQLELTEKTWKIVNLSDTKRSPVVQNPYFYLLLHFSTASLWTHMGDPKKSAQSQKFS